MGRLWKVPAVARGSIMGGLALLTAQAAAAELDPGTPPGRLLSLIRAIVPAGGTVIADAGTGDPFATKGTLEGLRIVFSEPYAGAGVPGGNRGLKELRIGELVATGVAGDNPDDAQASRIELHELAATFAPEIAIQASLIVYERAPLGEIFDFAMLSPAARSNRDSGPSSIEQLVAIDPNQQFRLTMERGSTAGVSAGIARDNRFQGLAYEGAEGRIRIGAMEIPEVSREASSRIARLGSEAMPPEPGQALAALADLVAAMPRVELHDIKISPGANGDDASSIAQMGYRIDNAAMGTLPFAVWIEGVRIDTGGLPSSMVAGASRLIDRPIAFDLRLEGSWNGADRRLTVKPLALDVKGAGRLELATELGSFPTAEVTAGMEPAEMGQAMSLTPIRGATISFTDHGLVDAFAGALAEQRRMTRTQFADSTVKAIGQALGPGLNERKRAAMADAIRQFIQRPGTLTFAFTPKDPQPVALLAAIAAQRPAAIFLDSRLDYTPPAAGR